jgi:hypothetical protein
VTLLRKDKIKTLNLSREYLMQFTGIVSFAYTTWAIGQFYEKRKIINYVKAFFAYVSGMLTFTLAAIIIGNLTDLIIKR